MFKQLKHKLLPLGLILVIAVLLVLTLSQTDTALGSGLFQSPMSPLGGMVAPTTGSNPVVINLSASSPIQGQDIVGGIPLRKVPIYEGYYPIIFKNGY